MTVTRSSLDQVAHGDPGDLIDTNTTQEVFSWVSGARLPGHSAAAGVDAFQKNKVQFKVEYGHPEGQHQGLNGFIKKSHQKQLSQDLKQNIQRAKSAHKHSAAHSPAIYINDASYV